MREVWVTAAVRTAVGDFGGGLKDVSPIDLGTTVVKAVLERSGVTGEDVGHLAFGQVVPTEPRDLYMSRVVSLNAGLPQESVAFNVNRLCGSGLQAVVSAAQSILLGDTEMAIGGGTENMSRGGYLSEAMRSGARMGDTKVSDMMVAALTDPFSRLHMGVTAENVAKQFEISREDQDALAVESHKRAVRAVEEGRFDSQIVPVVIKTRKGEVIFDKDEHPRAGTTMESLAKLRTVFVKENGTVTAGNASGINDGAAALMLMSGEAVKSSGVKPLARLVAYAHAGVDPSIMGIGPVPASRAVLEKAGLTLEQMDVIEANEAFAAQACAVSKEMGFDPDKVNPNGSGISLGHPIGATGAIVSVKAIHELHRTGGRYALVTMCIGGGQGIAAIFERA
ncbi:acetyl-CoA C-acyltransferase family protein [Orrella sp. 11846]|uniref:acetyl-CoA C-acyltransferase family protein n=1 Tax=Orrella sp. 11846 TaxID=3409913 RepID=UPI003B5C6D97